MTVILCVKVKDLLDSLSSYFSNFAQLLLKAPSQNAISGRKESPLLIRPVNLQYMFVRKVISQTYSN